MPQHPSAVLFDMDGTLVETEQHWGEAMFALADRLGGRMSAAARQRTVGTSMRTAMTVLYEDLGIRRSESQLLADARWVEDEVAVLMAASLLWRPGARELVEQVRTAGLPTALVTTTPRPLASIVLGQITDDLGEDPFDVTVCGDEVPARKPDPAPYRMAMTALGVEPSDCVALEDSLAGVSSAVAAGAAVLAVPSLQPLEPAPEITLRSSLVGVDLDVLAEVLAARARVNPSAA